MRCNRSTLSSATEFPQRLARRRIRPLICISVKHLWARSRTSGFRFQKLALFSGDRYGRFRGTLVTNVHTEIDSIPRRATRSRRSCQYRGARWRQLRSYAPSPTQTDRVDGIKSARLLRPAAPDRKASFQNARRTSAHLPNSDGSRRRADRTFRLFPWREAFRPPCRARLVSGSLPVTQQEIVHRWTWELRR